MEQDPIEQLRTLFNEVSTARANWETAVGKSYTANLVESNAKIDLKHVQSKLAKFMELGSL